MKKSALGFALVGALAVGASAQVTGHVDLYSAYVLRGSSVSQESETPAVQWGLDYAHSSGLYVGYWGSTLGYAVTADRSETGNQKSVENDFYLGYAGKVGDLGYDLGVTSYVYLPDDPDSSLGIEPKLKLSYGDFWAMGQFNARDVKYSNVGDLYLSAGYSHALPFDSTVTAGLTVGWYFYADSGKYASAKSVNSSAFRHVTLSLSKKVTPNLVVGLDGIIGGTSAKDESLGNALVAHASVVF